MADAPDVNVDFIRFFGRRLVEAETDERDCKVLDGNGNLSLRADASLLAVSNRHGVLFVGMADGLSWGCSRSCVAAVRRAPATPRPQRGRCS